MEPENPTVSVDGFIFREKLVIYLCECQEISFFSMFVLYALILMFHSTLFFFTELSYRFSVFLSKLHQRLEFVDLDST